MNCSICGKRVKENTEGKKGYCQGHSYFEIQKRKADKKLKDAYEVARTAQTFNPEAMEKLADAIRGEGDV